MTPRIENAPYLAHRHGQLTIEGWSRAGIHSYWRVPELKIGFDLGGLPWDWTATGHWFISHAHLDHLAALPGFLARRAMLKFTPPVIHVPVEVVADVRAMLDAWERLDRGRQECTLVGLAPGDAVSLDSTHDVTAFATEHPVPSRGYVVWERRHKLKAEFIGLPNEQLRDLRLAGELLTNEVRVPLVCYTGDTGPAGLDAEPAVYSAQVLIVEMSFARPDQERAKIHQYGHLHLEDFVERADRFQNERIVAGHLSSRDEPASFLELARQRLPRELSERIVVWGASSSAFQVAVAGQ